MVIAIIFFFVDKTSAPVKTVVWYEVYINFTT